MYRRLTILTTIIALLVLVNAYFFITIIRSPLEGPSLNIAQAFILPPNQVSYLPIMDPDVPPVRLTAKSALVYDLNSDRNLYERNIRTRLPIASLTKVMTAVVIWEKFSPNDQVVVGSTAVKVDEERQDLYENETISVGSLIKMMLIESSNDAAYALRDFASSKGIDLISEMNNKALALGMHDTRFLDTAGLNDSGYSTAADLVKLVRYSLRYSDLWKYSKEISATVTSIDGGISHPLESTNQLLGVIQNIIGGKTGYTDNALGCMILIIDIPDSKNDRVIGIILGSQGRFEDMKNLISWSQRAYSWQE